MTATQHYSFLLIEEFSHIAFACAVEPLRIANLVSEKALYQWSFISENGETARCSSDTVTLVHHDYQHIPQCDQLFLLSGINVHKHLTPALRHCVRQIEARNIPLGALCSGAYVLAKFGYLNGKKAAIHWEFHDGFMEAFPDINLVRNVFVADEKYVTASGGAAATDLMLHLIERDHGHELAIAVADQMVYNAVREASAEQRVSIQSRRGMRNQHLVKVIALMEASIDKPVKLSCLAEKAGVSTRQLERLFARYLNCSPRKYYVEMRLQKAQNLLIQTDLSVTEVALACGFDNPGNFSRLYRTVYGIVPSQQRGKIS